jgi:hypothetical protein
VIDHFDIERSIDGVNFTKVGETKGIGTACKSTPFGYREDVSRIFTTKIYYRIKAITAGGIFKRSQVIVIKKQMVSEIQIFPNPASHYVNIGLNALADGVAHIDVLDGAGKTILRQQQKVYRGSNSFSIEGIAGLIPGAYIIQVRTMQDITRKKLIIQPK